MSLSDVAYDIILTIVVGCVVAGIAWWSESRLARRPVTHREKRRGQDETPRHLDKAA